MFSDSDKQLPPLLYLLSSLLLFGVEHNHNVRKYIVELFSSQNSHEE